MDSIFTKMILILGIVIVGAVVLKHLTFLVTLTITGIILMVIALTVLMVAKQ